MREFFLDQMDYVYFVYGLSFFFLAVVVYFLWRMKPGQKFWKWIFVFGLLHGIVEWMDMLGMSFPENIVFKDIRVVVATASFMCFVELVREQLVVKYSGLTRLMIHGPLLLIVVGGGFALDGVSGFNALSRYFFGFLGGGAAVIVIWRLEKKDLSEKRFLDTFCLLLAGYAFTQLFVARAAFWPASSLTTDSFLTWVNLPVQVVRMAIAVVMAALVSRYYFRESGLLFPLTKNNNMAYWTVHVAGLFWALVILGGVLTHEFTQLRMKEEQQDLLALVKAMAHGFDPRHVANLTGAREDHETSSYVTLKEIGEKLISTQNKVEALHLWANRDGKIILLMDLERPPGVRSDLRQKMFQGRFASERKELVDIFNDQRERIVTPPTGTSDGELSFLIPLMGDHGNDISAVLEFLIIVDGWRPDLFKHRLFPIGITVLLVMISGSFLIILRREYESRKIIEEKERKHFALSLQLDEERDRLQTIFDAASVGLIVIDPDFRIVRANGVVAQMSGRHLDELLGDALGNVLNCVHSHETAGGCGTGPFCEACPLRQMVKKIFLTGETVRNLEVQHRLLMPSGVTATKWFEASATPIYVSKLRHVLLVLAEITHRKEVEALLIEARDLAEATDRAKGEFIANMSHEIRTPMNAILGFSELLNRSALSEKQKAYVDQIVSGGQILLMIINDILDISKISSGKMTLAQETIDLYAMMDDIISMTRPLIGDKPVELKREIDPLVPRRAIGDQLRLRQVIMNILGNATKFTHQGEIMLKVSMVEHGDWNDQLELHVMVKDTGIGIASGKLDDIFKPFVQEDMSTTKQYGGTGLGLSISQRLVAMMGGRIWVSSEPGKGSTFSFTVVLRKVSEEKPKAISLKVVEPQVLPVDLKGNKVLVVEDSIPNQELMKAYFDMLGCNVDFADNGLAAVKLLRDGGKYDLCLMDVQMPIMDGITATRIIHGEIAPGLPVIALTAGAMKEDAARCFEAGMTDYLAKPVDFDILKSKVMKYCKLEFNV